ncbi:hypothetical protein EDD29_3633 [Actinocorallia herbida]|uniref:Uncharacterized protein n=2 Tax=Actinocorallia herbida TaxID=58109 RepID=A0A3N1CXP8_9ACTN|nr:hypothetical protein EDD29_3633 [Actinocorallia herbida]
MFVLAVRRAPARPRWTLAAEGPEPQRRRALLGRLLMIVTGFGLFVGGAAVSVVGLTHVFVPSAVAFLRTTPTPSKPRAATCCPSSPTTGRAGAGH